MVEGRTSREEGCMQTRRGHGRADGSAPDSRTDRTEATTPGTSGQDGTDGTATWAPAEQGGRLVSLDEDQFAALVRPLRDARDARDGRDARRQPPPAPAE
jgi:hypothetical protein